MHSPVGSGTLIRKKDWVKDLCTFSIIYFIGKWTLTISKTTHYALFSLCILFSFLKTICFSKKKKSVFWAKKNIHLPWRRSLNVTFCPSWHQFLLQLQILCCVLIVSKPFFKLSVKSLGHFGFPLGLPFLQCSLGENQVSWKEQCSTTMMRNIPSSAKLTSKGPEHM